MVKTPALIPVSVGLLPGHGTKIPQAMWQKKKKEKKKVFTLTKTTSFLKNEMTLFAS